MALPLGVLVTVALLTLDGAPAMAHNCASVCKQIRRACRRVAKSERKAGEAVCGDQRDTCRGDCDANADACPLECTPTCEASCATDPTPATCEANCVEQCLHECDHCLGICNETRAGCLDDARLAQADANVDCNVARDDCQLECVDPIDSACVTGCKHDRRDCDRDAKDAKHTCRDGCGNGPDRNACVRRCRKEKNADFGHCSDVEVLCLGRCAKIVDAS
jgi:hypothetical protein